MRVLLLLGGLLAFATAGGAAENAAPAGEYRIQPGDTLEVGRYDDVKESMLDMVVSPAGSIAYPEAGAVPVEGLTTAEAEARLTQYLREQAHIRRPRVTVRLKALATKPEAPAPPAPAPAKSQVYVIGAVNHPGTFDLEKGMCVKDALGLAGGLAPGADGAKATLHSTKNGVNPVDLEKLMAGEPAPNLPLDVGDMLVVPARPVKEKERITVYVLGQVQRPGSVVMPADARITELAVASGGPLPGADLKHATVSRGKATIPVDLEGLLRRGDLKANLPLQDGDVVVVPEMPRIKVTLAGEFQKAGALSFAEGAKISDAWAAGNGATPSGDPESATLQRGGKEIPINFDDIVRLGKVQADQTLQDGDVLVIPPGMQIYVYSGVQKPGPVVIHKDTRLIDVLMAAGGALPNANLAKAGVVRDGKGKEKTEIIQINIKDAMEKGTQDRNFQFARNDVLVIPTRGERFTWQSALGALSAVGMIMNPISYFIR